MWKPIKYYFNSLKKWINFNYEVNENGEVRNIKTKKILKPYENGRNYYVLTLIKNKQKYRVKIHRIIGYNYLNLKPNLTIDHIDFNTKNNKLSNLQILTLKENIARKILNV